MKAYKPAMGTSAYKLKALMETVEDKEWGNMSEDEFVFACWVKRGYAYADATENIVHLYRNGGVELLNLAKTKVFGWKHFASLADESYRVQVAFCDWYINKENDERILLAQQGIKSPKKKEINAYFQKHNIDIVIGLS